MRLIPFLLASAAGFRCVQALVPVANTSVVAEQISLMSACALGCLESQVPIVGCGLLDTECQCASSRLVDLTATCLFTTCSLEETLEMSKSISIICERTEGSKNQMLKIMTYVCATITNGAVLARFLVRWALRQRVGMDDVFILLAITVLAIFTYFGVLFEDNGFGEHIWNVNFAKVPDLLYWFYICEALYVMAMGLVKISIIFFYLNVFPKKSFRIAAFSLMAFVGCSVVTFTLVGIFQCNPISHAWVLTEKGTCIDYNAAGWTFAGLNIFQDILIILLPINELRLLQISSKKRIGLYAMFGVGSFACITGIIRLYTLKHFGITADPTWDNVPTIFWSTLETTSSVLCACMPAMRAGLMRLAPKVFGETGLIKSSRVGGSRTWGSAGSKLGSHLSSTNGEGKTVHKRWLSRDAKNPEGDESIMLDTMQGDHFVRLPDARPIDEPWEHDPDSKQTYVRDRELHGVPERDNC